MQGYQRSGAGWIGVHGLDSRWVCALGISSGAERAADRGGPIPTARRVCRRDGNSFLVAICALAGQCPYGSRTHPARPVAQIDPRLALALPTNMVVYTPPASPIKPYSGEIPAIHA